MAQSALKLGGAVSFSQDIKFSHSIFALPFVCTGLLLAHIPFPSVAQLTLIVICMISARTFAMGMNRYFDADIDAMNPRTQGRAIPSGSLTRNRCLYLSVAFAGLFVLCSFLLSPLAGTLSAPLLLILAGYSLIKRFSWLSHWYLGICLGLAPIAAEIALNSSASIPVLLLGLAIAFWTAGFDLIYSLQDRGFDTQNGLHSVPARYGFRTAISVSILSFVMMVVLVIAAGILSNSGPLFYVGVVGVASLLIYQHWLIRDAWRSGTSSRINAAFFSTNAYVSVFFLFTVALDNYFYGI